jgi:hypothetical protein
MHQKRIAMMMRMPLPWELLHLLLPLNQMLFHIDLLHQIVNTLAYKDMAHHHQADLQQIHDIRTHHKLIHLTTRSRHLIMLITTLH